MPRTAHAYLPDGIEYVPVVMAPLPAVLEQSQEVLPVIGKVDAEEFLHLLGHLSEGYGALQCTGLLHERVYIVVDVKRPRAGGVAALVLGHLLVCSIIDTYLLRVELHDDGLPHEVVGHGVVRVLHADGGLLVHCSLQQVEAAEVTGEVEHALHVPAQCLPLVTRGDAAAFPVDVVADAAQPLLGALDGVEVDARGEGASSDKVHAALHMPLLPACTGIAETVREAVEGLHAQQRLRGLLAVRPEDDGHLHVVVHHHMGYTVHVVEEVAVRLHEGQVVLMAEEVGPAALAVAQGKDGHREGDLLARYAQLDLAPVKLALLAGLVVLLDEHILGLAPLLRLALLDVLAHARIADAEALLYQGAVDVLSLQALLPHACLPALRILR